MDSFSKLFILLGIILIAVGVLFTVADKVPWFGKLPGDIYIQKKNWSFYFPVVTCLLLSVLISLILILINKR